MTSAAPDTPGRRVQLLAAGLDAAGSALLGSAFEVAAAAHAGQRRRHGTPYIEHPVEVATIARRELGIDEPPVLAAAFLHDVVEDTQVSLDDLAQRFPPRTVELVELLTDPWPHLTAEERREEYRRIWPDRDATRLKAADRLSNLADALLVADRRFARRYARRTREELLAPGLPLGRDPVAGPLLRDAIRRAEELPTSRTA